MEKRKRLVLTWTKEQLDSYDDEKDFIKECLDEAAKVIGYAAIMNPNLSIQWIGNCLQENEEAGTISLYVDLNEYMVRCEEKHYERNESSENE